MSVPTGNIQGSKESIDFSITFVIKHHQWPLLLIEAKPPSDFRLDSGRLVAICQVIQHLDEIGPDNQYVDRLYAISAIGKRWRACYALKGKSSKYGQLVKGITKVSSLR